MKQADEHNTALRRALRREMVARRTALGDTTHAELSAHIVAHLKTLFSPPKIVAFCWPIKHEPDVRSIILAWIESGSLAALPVVVGEDEPLAFRHWQPEAPLVADRYGIPTPSDGDWLTPDLILIPLNGFDATGFRLGYGGGYFDRTLATLSPRPLAIGIGFETNRLESIHPEAHDQRLDWIVTEQGAFKVGDV